MKKDLQEVLRQATVGLCSELDPDHGLRIQLATILTPDQLSSVYNQLINTTPGARVHAILDRLQKCSNVAYYLFRFALIAIERQDLVDAYLQMPVSLEGTAVAGSPSSNRTAGVAGSPFSTIIAGVAELSPSYTSTAGVARSPSYTSTAGVARSPSSTSTAGVARSPSSTSTAGVAEISPSSTSTAGVDELSASSTRTAGVAELSPSSTRTSGVAELSASFTRTAGVAELSPSSTRNAGVAELSPSFTRTAGVAELFPSSTRTAGVAELSASFTRTAGHVGSFRAVRENTKAQTDKLDSLDRVKQVKPAENKPPANRKAESKPPVKVKPAESKLSANLKAESIPPAKVKPAESDQMHNISKDKEKMTTVECGLECDAQKFLDKPTVVLIPSVLDHVNGLTVLNDDLFVVHYESIKLNVYNTKTFILTRKIKIANELTNWEKFSRKPSPLLWAIVSSKQYKCLYISDVHLLLVYRYDFTIKAITRWSVGGKCYGLSETSSYTVLVTLRGIDKIIEYKTDGSVIREIRLNTPNHCVELSSDRLVVSQPSGLVIVDMFGKIINDYDEVNGYKFEYRLKKVGNVAKDKNGNILVADASENRIVLLSPLLTHLGGIALPDYKMTLPCALHFDEENHRLYIGEHYDSGRLIVLSY